MPKVTSEETIGYTIVKFMAMLIQWEQDFIMKEANENQDPQEV